LAQHLGDWIFLDKESNLTSVSLRIVVPIDSNPEQVRWIGDSAATRSAGPGKGFFFGGFDLSLCHAGATTARDFGA
jgi:hypothetical protein